MPAITTTGERFLESGILDPARYTEMVARPLYSEDDPDQPVVPVRHRTKPHFRALPEANLQGCIGRAENNPVHDLATMDIAGRLGSRPAPAIYSATFGGQGIDHRGHLLLGRAELATYRWWTDGVGTVIPVGRNCHIKPDLCGRSVSTDHFWPSVDRPAVIMEVVQRHFPEAPTLYQLFGLAERNHLVMLYFVKPTATYSKYSWYDEEAHSFHIAFVLRGRHVVKNGVPYGRPAPRGWTSFCRWYTHLDAALFSHVMREKDM